MAYLLTLLKVKDYSKWKPIFDEYAAIRKKHGSKGGRLLRTADNPNEPVVLLEWESLEKAKKYTQSDEIKKAFQQGGVSKSEFYLLEEVEQVSG